MRQACRLAAGLSLVVVLALVLAGVSGPARAGEAPRATAAADPLARAFGGPFSLTAQDGRRVTAETLHGRFVLLVFGYTHCPDVCPTDLMAITQAMDALGAKAEPVSPVFVTVDPARDTPEVLASYLGAFHPRFLGLGGTEAEVAAAARAFKVHRRKVLPAPGSADYYVDHGSLIYLLGPDGAVRTLMPAGTDAARIASIVASYLP